MDGHDAVEVARAPRLRLSRAQRQALGEKLAMTTDRHAVTAAAQVLGVSPRSLRRLRQQVRSGDPLPRMGRPPYGARRRARVRGLVAQERERQGATAGGRPILAALRQRHPRISKRLVCEGLATLKASARAQATAAIEAAREGVTVLGRDTVWGEDTTHLGRLDTGEESTGEHVRDLATLATVSLSVGPPPTGEDVAADLRRAAEQRGGYPLVLQHDNGSAYVGERVRRELKKERVIALISRVHTPTDNPAIEHGHDEVKTEAGLGKGVVLEDHLDAALRLAPAIERLDACRLRASRGWHTPAELDAMLPRGDQHVDRAAFYGRARTAMRAAVLGLEDPAAARQAEREAVFATLCEFGLARRHVGPRPRVGSVPWPDARRTPGAQTQEG
jgi:transposase InsO family protein